MAERITPHDFATGAPPRIMGTEAEDHVHLRIYGTDAKLTEERQAINTLLSDQTFQQAGITVYDQGNLFYPKKWLANGQKIYHDGDMLESCTAEQLGPKRALTGTLAAIRVLEKLADASELPIQIFRRSATVDHQTQTVKKSGFHMNHLTPYENAKRIIKDGQITGLQTHSATRLYTWEGMVAPDGFTLSQKSHGYNQIAGIRFYKDKVKTDESYQRLEDYSGDDSSPWGTFMAMATTSVLLRVLEHQDEKDLNKRLRQLQLERPDKAIQTVSADTTLKETLPLADGRRLTAIAIQTELADIAEEFGKRFRLPEDEQYAVDQWQTVCRDLKEAAETGEIRPLAHRIGWVSKKLWLERRNIGPLQANNPEAVRADMSWDSLYPKKGGRLLYPERTGLTIVSEPEVIDLVTNPPRETRAAIRANYIQTSSFHINGINWDHILGKHHYGMGRPQRIKLDPYQTEV